MRIRSVKYQDLTKLYRLGKSEFTAPRFCCLGPGDHVVRTDGKVVALCENGRAQILPSYIGRSHISIGGRSIPVRIKEIETEDELAGYHHLEKCHYRGKALHGRRVPLIIRCEDPLLPLVLGYIELTTAFMMSKPRAAVFNAPFLDDDAGVAWKAWTKDYVRKYTNLVVRIARVVVSPEFRGLGIARVLVEHAAKFAKKHWHVGGLKPLFIEITADMLRFVPFVESAGMRYIGDTEGNLERVGKDMKYILGNIKRVKRREILREDSAGIVDLQVYYADALRKTLRRGAMSLDQALALLMKSPERLSDENWALLHRVLRLPKPTFLAGLTPSAKIFLKTRAEALKLPEKYPSLGSAARPRLRAPIKIRQCSLTRSSNLIRTRATRKIQQAFGVDRDMLDVSLFSKLSFEITPGDVVLICGPSGVGKSTLLSLLTRSIKRPEYRSKEMTGSIRVPSGTSMSQLEPLDPSRPIISALGDAGFEHALHALNVSGLAEAHLYIKRFKELSNGQRYRAMMAKLIASRSTIWVADEFCATLDAVTANIVARNLRRCAKDLGTTVILAAANWREFIHELRPDKVIHLRAPWDYQVFAWPDFEKAVARSRAVVGRQAS
jgi:ABC-type lipoprotein export system ATPase subunit/GNAT superfamily N-acetyltransferase